MFKGVELGESCRLSDGVDGGSIHQTQPVGCSQADSAYHGNIWVYNLDTHSLETWKLEENVKLEVKVLFSLCINTYWLICPIRTRFGPVPVRVAMPPMLAA